MLNALTNKLGSVLQPYVKFCSSMKFALIISLCLGIGLTIEVSRMQYYYHFKDKMHENWILDTFEDYHMLTCSKECLGKSDCDGLALGPLGETLESHTRTCYLLANVIEDDCNKDYDCANEGVQIYLKTKPLTTTTTTTTTTSASTTTTSTEAELEETESSTTSTTPTEPTATETSTTTTKEPTTESSVEDTTITTEESTSSTESSDTTSTSTEEPSTTSSTTTTEEETTAADDTTTSTSEEPTTEETTSTTAEPTTTSTEESTTTTTEESTMTTTEESTTTTEEPTTTEPTTTTTQDSTTTTEDTTTTTEDTTTTTEEQTTTTTEATTSTTTEATTSTTTEATTSTTTEATTTTETTTTSTADETTTTTEAQTTTTEGTTTTTEEPEPEEYDEKCEVNPINITCPDPVAFKVVTGLSSNTALWSDANIKVTCEQPFREAVFKTETKSKKYEPFSGKFACQLGETMTGVEFCFRTDIKYIAPFCTSLEDGFQLDTDNTVEVRNSADDSTKVTCPKEYIMLTLRLQNEDGTVITIMDCAKLSRK